jgi:hypothetical protein
MMSPKTNQRSARARAAHARSHAPPPHRPRSLPHRARLLLKESRTAPRFLPFTPVGALDGWLCVGRPPVSFPSTQVGALDGWLCVGRPPVSFPSTQVGALDGWLCIGPSAQRVTLGCGEGRSAGLRNAMRRRTYMTEAAEGRSTRLP